jgi:hypothetical protein
MRCPCSSRRPGRRILDSVFPSIFYIIPLFFFLIFLLFYPTLQTSFLTATLREANVFMYVRQPALIFFFFLLLNTYYRLFFSLAVSSTVQYIAMHSYVDVMYPALFSVRCVYNMVFPFFPFLFCAPFVSHIYSY